MTLSAPTQLLASSSTADSATYTTGSITPVSGSRIVAYGISGKSGNLAEAPTGLVQNGAGAMGALSLIRAQAIPNTNLVLTSWTGVGTGVAGTLTFTHANVMENMIWRVIQHTSDVATPIIKQHASSASATTGTVTVALPNAVTAGSCVLGALAINNSTAATAATGHTLLGALINSTSPVSQHACAYDNTSPFSAAGFAVSSTSGRATMAIEIADGVASSGPTLTVWNGTEEVPATLTVWNGSAEVPATLSVAP